MINRHIASLSPMPTLHVTVTTRNYQYRSLHFTKKITILQFSNSKVGVMMVLIFHPSVYLCGAVFLPCEVFDNVEEISV